jgi:uncharacterized protein YdaU (DUF1376 family)
MKPPAFQLYAADFYMDTNTWSIEEIGIYTRLLFSEWVNGPLPNNETRLARASGCSVKRFRGGWSQVKLKFSVTEDDKLYNERLENVRQEQIEYQEIQRIKGIKSAEKRWSGHVTTVKPRLQPGHKPDCNPSSSSSSSSSKKLSNTIFIIPTMEQVSAYCKERGKGINPQTWMDHYTSNGWMIGKNKMKDWKAAVRTWESRGENRKHAGIKAWLEEKENEETGYNKIRQGNGSVIGNI